MVLQYFKFPTLNRGLLESFSLYCLYKHEHITFYRITQFSHAKFYNFFTTDAQTDENVTIAQLYFLKPN